jgi:cation:H+ antiporter
METLLVDFLNTLSPLFLFLIIAVTLFTLSKGADILVDEAVSLSVRWGIPKMIIGATIVSLGTTLPEATVSVLAAIEGNPDLALGNAVGSVIADTGLIIGLAALVGTLPVVIEKINKQGRIQLMAGILLVVVSLPIFSKTGTGVIHQWVGFLFLGLLVVYMVMTIRWARQSNNQEIFEMEEEKSNLFIQIMKLIIGITLVILSSKVLIPSVEITAIRIGIPQSVIAATLVAFGTSLPELVTAITAVRKGHGELAVGNIIGADILNVLFVVGSAAAVTSSGLAVPVDFYWLQFPAMLLILVIFRIVAKNKRDVITKKEGLLLLGIYVIYIVLNYVVV